ncbi:MAG: hypothetical protein AABM67_03115 [Acidobacteriota bacterium]
MRKVSVCVFGHIHGSRTRFMLPALTTLMPQSRKIQSLGFASDQVQPSPSATPTGYLTMLKRFSSLILALVIGGSVFAGTTRLEDEHVCEMAGMEAMPGMETMPCCKKNQNAAVESESGPPEQCCVNIPPETGSHGTTYNLRAPSFSIAVIHPAVAQSPLAVPKPYECSYSPQVFLPNLQASYIRNLSILI